MTRTAVILFNYKWTTGIDGSKDYFDISVLEEHKVEFEDMFSNERMGFEELLVHVLGSHITMEATYPYYFQLERFLHVSGQKVSVVNPLVVCIFSQMQLPEQRHTEKMRC